MKKWPFYILMLVTSFQCKNGKAPGSQTTADSIKTQQPVATPAPVTQQPAAVPEPVSVPAAPKHFSDTAVIITDTTSIEIRNLKKYGIDEDSDKRHLAQCKKWNPDSASIDKMLRNFEPIDGTGWDLAYSHLDCKIFGDVTISGKEYSLEINAGSWLSLTTKDTMYLFVPRDKSFDKYFILHVGQ